MSAGKGGVAPHILHIFPDDSAIELIRAFGTKLRHTLVTRDGTLPTGLSRSPYLKAASDFPSLEGFPTLGRMQKLARAMTPFDLVLTHGWEGLDAAMAHTLFKDAMDLPALVHHEHEPDARHSLRRKWYRRLALGKAAGLVVPGEYLEGRALVDWQQPMGRVKRIAPGIDAKAFAKKPKRDSFRLIKHDGEMWVGVWPDRFDGKALVSVIQALADLEEQWQLIVLGERQDSAPLDNLIDELAINARVHFPGPVADPARVMGLFDLFVVVGETDAFPRRTAEAMAAALPVIAPQDSESVQLLAEENREWSADTQTASILSANLRGLAEDTAARARIGEANRARAVQLYDRDKTVATYRRLYASAMKQEF